jgi:parallel beta-helix repeat protein
VEHNLPSEVPFVMRIRVRMLAGALAVLAIAVAPLILPSPAVREPAVRETPLQTGRPRLSNGWTTENRTEVDFISINGNEAFLETAQDFGWPGTGKEWDPIIIEGYFFRNTYHMFVATGTDLYWKFTNNILDGIDEHWCEIVISNLCNAEISNNVFMKGAVGIHTIRVNDSRFIANEMYEQSFDGVYMEYSHRNMIAHNRFHDNGESGVYAWQSSTQNSITGNEVFNCPYGFMLLAGASSNIVRGNDIHDIDQAGLHIQTADNVIEGNLVHNVAGDGAGVSQSGNEIMGNRIYNNSGYGINFASISGENTISHNVFLFNQRAGVSLQRSEGNLIRENDFYHNGAAQAIAYEEDNTFSHNYWHEWIGNDTTGNGIIDTVKEIYGGVCIDLLPSLTPINTIPSWYSFVPITGPPPEEPEPTVTTTTMDQTTTGEDTANFTTGTSSAQNEAGSYALFLMAGISGILIVIALFQVSRPKEM